MEFSVILCLITLAPSITLSDMDLSDEQYDLLTGNIDYDDYDSFGNVWARGPDDLFRWDDGTIPFEFDQQNELPQDYKNRINAAMERINSNLVNCINFR